MELQLPQLAVYSYNNGGRVLLTQKRKMMFLLCLFVSLALGRILFPFGLLALIFPAMVYFGGARTLKIGARYLICADRIVYYSSVKRLIYSEAEGVLTLKSGQKVEFVIERNRFRKKASRAADFNAVVNDLIEKVRLVAPDALLPEEVESSEIED
ncbi:MAG: hypothetical protein WCK63_00610 [Betaproteobacteria bacterium]